MEPSYPSGGGRQPPLPSPPKKELPLQGPRPSPLRIAKQSYAVEKPPRPHRLPHPAASSSWAPCPTHLPAPAALAGAGAGADRQQPTIIFDISPKVIHVEEWNFMSIVQQLTGSSSTSSGDVSPAARVAAIQRTSSTGRAKGFAAASAAAAAGMGWPSAVAGDDELMYMLGDVQLAQSQGILTPATPPAISAGFFSPATEPHMLQDLSPFWPPNNSYNSPSASTMFMAFSPSPTASVDLFNLFSSSGDVSPAARLAAIERTNPTGREKGFAAAAAEEMGWPSAVAGDDELMCMLGDVELAQSQDILTPVAPQAISVGFFSPATEPHTLQDLSPFRPQNNSYNSPSASTLFMAFCPSPIASVDLFNLFSNY